MIKVSFHKIIMKKSRIWPFLTLGFAECTKGLAESGLLAESMTQKPKKSNFAGLFQLIKQQFKENQARL